MRNKRKTSRVPVDMYLNKYMGGIPYMARASNIGPDGVGLQHLIEPQYEGREVGLQFQLPGSNEVIYAEGEVVREWLHLSRQGYGVRFTYLTKRDRKLIDEFVATHGNGK